MVDFITTRNIKSSVWHHSYANSVPHPYGGVPDQSTGREDEYYRWHEEMTRYNRYLYGATIFYKSNGLPDDWMMGGAPDNNLSTGSGQGIIATTPEHGGEWFWPTPSTIIPIAKQSMRISLGTAYYGGKYAKLHDLIQSNITETSNVDLDFGIERIGQTQSNFTVKVTPISSNILSIVSPSTESGIPINTTTNPTFRNQKNVTATMQLNPAITANEKIEYNVKLSNDNGIIYEANYEKYYQPILLFDHIPDTNGLTGWTQSGGWTNTTSDAYSGTNSISTGTYANGTTKTLTTTNSYDFSNSNEVLIQFYSKWDIERNYDFLEVLGSPDGGSNWIVLSGKYTKPNATSETTSHYNKDDAIYADFQANSSGQIYDGDRMDNWVMEEITIDNTYSTLLNSTDVKIRFIFRTDNRNVNENYTTTNDGFYFDDFKVVKIQDPCSSVSVPTNLNSLNISQTAASITWDEIASVNYDLRYRENGASTWIYVFDISTLDYQLSGLDSSTQYEVQLRSKCNDANTSNYTVSENFTTLAVVPCIGTVFSDFSIGYSESFESNLGDWTNNTGDDIEWTRDRNGTPSSNTGPSDGTEGVGSWYLYTEASVAQTPFIVDGFPNKSAEIISPCFDLSGFKNAQFSFDYHWYGTNIDEASLSVDVSNDNGATYTAIFSKTGGTSSDSWVSVPNIDLSAYNGQTIKLKFTGTTGNSWSSDMAIDNFSLTAEVDASLGIQDEILSQFNLYPNPSNIGEVRLTLPNEIQEFNVEISNLLGQKLISKKMINQASKIHRINTGSFKTGVYFVSVITELGRATKKLIIE